jgi:hypothetical protein
LAASVAEMLVLMTLIVVLRLHFLVLPHQGAASKF